MQSRRELLVTASTGVVMTTGCLGSSSSPVIKAITTNIERQNEIPASINPTIIEHPKHGLVEIVGAETDTLECPEFRWSVSPVGADTREVLVETTVVNNEPCTDSEVRVEMFPYRISIWFEKIIVGGKLRIETSKTSGVHSFTGVEGVTQI
jgi:hypothetical protein